MFKLRILNNKFSIPKTIYKQNKMPNPNCLPGPAFTVIGDAYFSSNAVSFEVVFDNPAEQASVKAYEWYLDGSVIAGHNDAEFAGQLNCGPHHIGVKVLSAAGWSGMMGLEFATCRSATELLFYGVASINEGESTTYYIYQLFSDGTSIDVTADYVFSSTPGASFNGNIFTADTDPAGYDDYVVTISATKSGQPPLTKQVTVFNTTPVVLVSTDIVGPGALWAGDSAFYSIIASYSNGTSQDVTAQYVLSSTVGTFSGNLLSIPGGNNPGSATIFASQSGVPVLSKQIVINAVTSGVLVVDLFQDPALNVIGLIDNPEVAESHIPAYTGVNIIPAGANPAEAMVLSSDYFPTSSSNWRFQFNIEKLVNDYPLSRSFVFYIKGRSAAAGRIYGAYSVKTNDAVMKLQAYNGPLIPSVTGGSNHVPVTNFDAEIGAGANGSYNEADLHTIIKFTYDVPTDTTTYVTNEEPIVIGDFDFMAIRYHWGIGDGSDLDIMVGYENNQSGADNKYVGFGTGVLVPDNVTQAESYLWWGLDNTGPSGYEGVLIGIKKFIENNPASSNIIEVALYAVWHSEPITGNFSVELVTYKGGTMSLVGNNFVNEGGVQTSSNVVNSHTLMRKTGYLPSNYFKVGIMRYNKTTQTGTIQINGN